MNVSHVADILSVKHDDASKSTEYTRPIYAGNAILQIKTSQDKDRIGIVSVRTTAFDKAPMGGSGAEVEEVTAQAASSMFSHVIANIVERNSPDRTIHRLQVPPNLCPRNSQPLPGQTCHRPPVWFPVGEHSSPLSNSPQ